MPAETHRAAGVPNRNEVAELVADIVIEMTGPTTEAPAPSARLIDIGVDDLTLLSVVEALEHELGERTVGLSVDDDDLADLFTLGDIVDLVCSHLDAAGSGS